MRSIAVAMLLMLATTVFGSTEQSEPVVWPSKRGIYMVSYDSELKPLRINRIHSWVVHVVDIDGQAVVGASLQLDGGMPEHDHGLPTRPQMTAELGAGDYLFEGVRFHMAGRWLLELSIEANGARDVAIIDLEL